MTLELSGVPQGTEYRALVTFVNTHAPTGFRYLGLQLNGTLAKLQLQASEATAVMTALQGQHIVAGSPISVALGAATGRALVHGEKQSLQSAVRSAYNAQSKVLDLGSLAQRDTLRGIVNFHSQNFTSELFNAIQQAAPDAVSINLANNNIQTLSCFQGMVRAVPHLQNLSLQNNSIVK